MRRLAMFTSIAMLLVACPASPPPPPPPASQPLVVEPSPAKAPAPVASEAAPPAPASTTCTRDDECGMVARCQSGACVIVETAAPRIACKTTDDCWFDDAHKPIARPPNLRGKKVTPCKGNGEHAPACEAGACVVRAYKC